MEGTKCTLRGFTFVLWFIRWFAWCAGWRGIKQLFFHLGLLHILAWFPQQHDAVKYFQGYQPKTRKKQTTVGIHLNHHEHHLLPLLTRGHWARWGAWAWKPEAKVWDGPVSSEDSLHQGKMPDQFLCSHYNKKLYHSEVLPGTKLFNIYSFTAKQMYFVNADE